MRVIHRHSIRDIGSGTLARNLNGRRGRSPLRIFHQRNNFESSLPSSFCLRKACPPRAANTRRSGNAPVPIRFWKSIFALKADAFQRKTLQRPLRLECSRVGLGVPGENESAGCPIRAMPITRKIRFISGSECNISEFNAAVLRRDPGRCTEPFMSSPIGKGLPIRRALSTPGCIH